MFSRRARQESDGVERPEPASADPGVDIETRDTVAFLMGHLSERDQRIMRMRHWDGLSYAAIGEALGVTGESVRLWVAAAAATMREVACK